MQVHLVKTLPSRDNGSILQTDRAACHEIESVQSLRHVQIVAARPRHLQLMNEHIAYSPGRYTFVSRAWGALSVPRKNFLLPLMAAAATACRWRSLFKIGKQKE